MEAIRLGEDLSEKGAERRGREYLIDDDNDQESQYSALTVSSVDEKQVDRLLVPSTKILKFPMKQDQSQVLEIRVMEAKYIQKEP